MRHFVLAAALVAAATVARADTLSTTATAAAPASEPRTYVSAGAMAGGSAGYLTAALTAQLGYQLPNSPLWLHAMVVEGATGELLTSGQGTFTQVRVGVEAKTCVLDGIVCSLFGVDVGYQHADFSGQELSFGDGNGAMTSSAISDVVVVPRYTLDIGNTWVRFRPGVEIPLSNDGAGLELTAALAVRF